MQAVTVGRSTPARTLVKVRGAAHLDCCVSPPHSPRLRARSKSTSRRWCTTRGNTMRLLGGSIRPSTRQIRKSWAWKSSSKAFNLLRFSDGIANASRTCPITYTCGIDAEPLHRYRSGGYHPVALGDLFNNGRYKVLHKLGWGGYSTVWAARDLR